MCSAKTDVRFVPKADIDRLFDHLVGAPYERIGDVEPERLRGLKI
jgi:hypothetical protein